MDLSNKACEELIVLLENTINVLNNPRSDQSRINKAFFLKDKVFQEFSSRTNELRRNMRHPVMKADGVLSAFNYHVGDGGITCAKKRLEILKLIIESPIPPIKDIQYVEKWGEPRTAKRLKVLQRTLDGFIHYFSRNTNAFQFRRAISHWEHDLRAIENLPIQLLVA